MGTYVYKMLNCWKHVRQEYYYLLSVAVSIICLLSLWFCSRTKDCMIVADESMLWTWVNSEWNFKSGNWGLRIAGYCASSLSDQVVSSQVSGLHSKNKQTWFWFGNNFSMQICLDTECSEVLWMALFGFLQRTKVSSCCLWYTNCYYFF